MPSKPPSQPSFAGMIDGPTLTMPTLNPLSLNRDVEVSAVAEAALARRLAEFEARSVSRATKTEFREEERREFRRHVADILNLEESTIPLPRPTAKINYPGDSIWISLDSFGGEVWTGSEGTHVHRAPRSGASFILLQRVGASAGFGCEGASGTYLFVARVETRQRTLRASVLENADLRMTQDLQIIGDKVLLLAELGVGGRLTVSYSCEGSHPVRIFGVEAYRVR